jgi:excisionase family DNA binding protein
MSTATAMLPEPLMTAEEVAAFLKVSLSMVYKLRREGALPGVQIGALWRWAPEVVRAFSRGEGPSPGAPVVPLSRRRRRV